MRKVAREAVAEVNRSSGDTAQRHAKRHPRRGPLQTHDSLLHQGWRQRDGFAQCFKPEPRIAWATADINIVAGARSRAQQRLAGRHFAKHGDADIERALGGVAAYELTTVGVGQRPQPA